MGKSQLKLIASNLDINVFASIFHKLLQFGQVIHAFDKLLVFWTRYSCLGQVLVIFESYWTHMYANPVNLGGFVC